LRRLEEICADILALEKETEGWLAERLALLLAGVIERLLWLRQWHNELDAAHGVRMGDYFGGFIEEEARALGMTGGAIRSWMPPANALSKKGKGKRPSRVRR
jgi:hypothetical protein